MANHPINGLVFAWVLSLYWCPQKVMDTHSSVGTSRESKNIIPVFTVYINSINFYVVYLCVSLKKWERLCNFWHPGNVELPRWKITLGFFQIIYSAYRGLYTPPPAVCGQSTDYAWTALRPSFGGCPA
jgi:hypothetical protein